MEGRGSWLEGVCGQATVLVRRASPQQGEWGSTHGQADPKQGRRGPGWGGRWMGGTQQGAGREG